MKSMILVIAALVGLATSASAQTYIGADVRIGNYPQRTVPAYPRRVIEEERIIIEPAPTMYREREATYGRTVRPAAPQPSCKKEDFHYSAREKMCVRHVDVDVTDVPSPYDEPDEQAHCKPGDVRHFTTTSPEGYRRVVDQVCNVHHRD